MKVIVSIFFVLAVANSILAQQSDRAILNGKIEANSLDLEGIYIINLKTEKSAITEKEGFFSIVAIPGDTLLFSAMQLKEIRVVLKPEDFQDTTFVVKMESRITQLEEVVIKRYENINAVALGISSGNIKHLTPAERKLYTANSTPVDALLNVMSGRTAMLKKGIEVEKKIAFLSQIENMFEEDYFRNKLKIPVEYIKGFHYYMVENDAFTKVLQTKNKISIEFLMVLLAAKFNEMISTEVQK